MAMVDVDRLSDQSDWSKGWQWSALFSSHQTNWVNSHNGHAVMTAP